MLECEKICKLLCQKKFAKLWVNIVAKGNILGWLLYFCNNHWWTRYVWYKFQLCQLRSEERRVGKEYRFWWLLALLTENVHRREMGVRRLDRESKVTYGAYHLEPLKCG